MSEFPISPDYVPKYFKMNPVTDGLLFDATELQEGMVVILQAPEYRVNVDSLEGLLRLAPKDAHQAMYYNRWGRVKKMKVPGVNNIHVALEYADGSEGVIVASVTDPWYVKKDSIPKTSPEPIPWGGCTIIHETAYVDGRYVNVIKHVPVGDLEPNSEVKWEENLDYHPTRLSPEVDLRDLNRSWERSDRARFKDFLRGKQSEEPLADWEKELETNKPLHRRQFGDGLNNDHGN